MFQTNNIFNIKYSSSLVSTTEECQLTTFNYNKKYCGFKITSPNKSIYLEKYISTVLDKKYKFEKDTNSFELYDIITKDHKVIFFSNQEYQKFKDEFNIYMNRKYGNKYYKSGNLKYFGEMNKYIEHGEGIEYFDTPDKVIKYDGEFEDGEYDGAGRFYDKNHLFYVTANNISQGIPRQTIFVHNLQTNQTKSYKFVPEKNYDKKYLKKYVKSDLWVLDMVQESYNYDDHDINNYIFMKKDVNQKLFTIYKMLQKQNNQSPVKVEKNFTLNESTPPLSEVITIIVSAISVYFIMNSIFITN